MPQVIILMSKWAVKFPPEKIFKNMCKSVQDLNEQVEK